MYVQYKYHRQYHVLFLFCKPVNFCLPTPSCDIQLIIITTCYSEIYMIKLKIIRIFCKLYFKIVSGVNINFSTAALKMCLGLVSIAQILFPWRRPSSSFLWGWWERNAMTSGDGTALSTTFYMNSGLMV